jgi:adenylate cyclase
MREALRTSRENHLLRAVVNPGLVRRVRDLEHTDEVFAPETIDATVLFVDVCGFTSYSEARPAHEAIAMLNRCFDVVVPIIGSHGGEVDKFIGDAVMAVFRGEGHAARAIDAAIDIRGETERLSGLAAQRERWFPRVSLGLNTGSMVAGAIGSHELDHMDYTVIGDVVNVAARLQNLAEPGQILVVDSTFAAVARRFSARRLGSHIVRNKKEPLVVYDIMGRR